MAATYELIATTTLSSAAASITFSSIPATYTDLKLVFSPIGSTSNYPYLRLNSDTGSNYSLTRLEGDGSTALSSRQTNQTETFIINDSLVTTTRYFIGIDFMSYAGSTNKTFLIEHNGDRNGSGQVLRMVGLWRNTSAINTILLYVDSGNFASGTTATLYGILKA